MQGIVPYYAHYVQGLLSHLDKKNVETIAYLHDQERQALQKFIGQSPWDHQPFLAELTRQIGAELGEAYGRGIIELNRERVASHVPDGAECSYSAPARSTWSS